jgi:hypothetical protein
LLLWLLLHGVLHYLLLLLLMLGCGLLLLLTEQAQPR